MKGRILFVCLLLIFSSQAVVGLDIGLSPSTISISNAAVNNSISRSVFVSRSDTTIPFSLPVSWEGNASDFFVSLPKSISFDKEQTVIEVPIQIEVPQDSSVGTYVATVFFSSEQSAIQSGISTKIALPLSIIIEVTDKEVHKYKAVVTKIPSQSMGKGILLETKFSNEGNVIEKDMVAYVEVWNAYDNESLGAVKVLIEDVINPFSEKIISTIIPFDIPQGQYWAKVRYDNSSEKKIFFTVNENKEVVIEKEVPKEEKSILLPIIMLLFGIGCLVVFFVGS